MKLSKFFAIVVCGVAISSASARAGSFEIGVGANYWHSLKDAITIDSGEKFDEDGLGWMISTRWMWNDYMGLGIEVEQSPDSYVALEEKMYAPSAHLIIGKGIYLGFGAGTYYYDGDFYSDPWYNLRLGIKMNLLPFLALDLNANYRTDSFNKLDNVKDVDSESLTFGAAVRLIL